VNGWRRRFGAKSPKEKRDRSKKALLNDAAPARDLSFVGGFRGFEKAPPPFPILKMRMDNRPIVTRVVLENFKSIAFCDVKLGPLTILVGPNGAGKSNFLNALHFLSDAVQGNLATVVRSRGGFDALLKRRSANHLGMRIEFTTSAGAQGYYSFRLERDLDEDFVIRAERCALGGPRTAWYKATRGKLESSLEIPAGLVRDGLYLPVMSGYSEFKPAYDLLSKFQFYNPNPRQFLLPSGDEDRTPFLRNDGTNLANVFNRLHLVDLARKISDPTTRPERVTEYLQVINPEITDITTEAFGGFRSLKFYSKSSPDSPFLPFQMSDGTLRSLAVLVALFQAVGGIPEISLVGLEEPESALHPAAAGVLFDAMREASASVQVIATTHSADLLDKKDIDTHTILAVELRDGSTQIGPVDHTGRQSLKDRLYTAGELMRMNYLRPESNLSPSGVDIESVLFGDTVPA
jgi:predicted ATPase